VRCYSDIEEETSSLTGGLDVPRSIQKRILVIVSRIINDNDGGSNNHINNNDNNSILLNQFGFFYVLTQQPQDQLHRQHRNIRKIQR